MTLNVIKAFIKLFLNRLGYTIIRVTPCKTNSGMQQTSGASTVDYNRIHVERAKNYYENNFIGKRCLIVGCNTGKDCRYFLDFGAASVDGVDVVDDIGKDFQHPNVRYHKISAEKMIGLNDNEFDIVYCFATMEHVPDIQAAFSEMARVTRPGGIMYCVSAPLWNSRNGHHKSNFFDDYPWIHLRLSVDEIIAYCHKNNIVDSSGSLPMRTHIEYMLNPAYFNKRPSSDYVTTCSSLKGMEILVNTLASDDNKILTPVIFDDLKQKGYTADELLAVVHNYVGVKR